MAKQFLIIDGYNFLHVNGFIDSRSVGPGTLEKARNQLLGMLRKHLELPTRKRTTVVFDSSEPDLPGRLTMHEVLVEFANQHEDADALIAIMVARHSAPKQLTVVSSDHQVQQKAKARGAKAIDSDQWLETLEFPTPVSDGPLADSSTESHGSEKPTNTNSDDKEFWKNEFQVDGLNLELERDGQDRLKQKPDSAKPGMETPGLKKPGSKEGLQMDDTVGSDSANTVDENDIFPPGYADDLFDES